MTVAEAVAARGIVEILHFTTHLGLLGILDCGAVKPRSMLESDERLEYILKLASSIRKDPGWLDYVNLSISKVNASYFRVARRRHPEVGWAILAFAPAILSHDGVMFCTTNNIYPSACRAPGAQGLEALFATEVRGKYDRRMVRTDPFPTAHPTDPQAEVLYPGPLALAEASRIYLPNYAELDSVAGQCRALGLEPSPELVCDPNLFPG